MDNKKNINDVFLETVKKIVYTVLKKEKLLLSEFHFGKVDQVVSNKQLSIFVDGSTTAQKIPCNPDITFNVGDSVLVVFINNDSKNKFVLSRIIF